MSGLKRLIYAPIALLYLAVRTLLRAAVWPVGAAWSYFADATKAPAPSEVRFASAPILLHGDNGTGVVLFHGWTSTPYEMRALARRLHAAGCTVYVPLLAGHGTVPEDLEGVTCEDWIADAQRAYDTIAQTCARVFVGGMSFGGSLALITAARNRVAGVIALGTPFAFRRQRIGIVTLKLWQAIKRYERKYYSPIGSARSSLARHITYQRYPIESALEAFRVVRTARRTLRAVSAPLLLMQSRNDHLITRTSIHEIARRVRSRTVRKKVLANAYHNFIADPQHAHIYRDIVAFVADVSAREGVEL